MWSLLILFRLVVSFIDLDLSSLPTSPSSYPAPESCSLSSDWCRYIMGDFWTLYNALWVSMHGMWVTLLLVMQSTQIMTQKTSNEVANSHRFDYLTHPEDKHAPVYRKRSFNPFDLGPIGNCVDFWSNGGALRNLSWFNTYEVPADLMAKALQRKSADNSMA